MKRIILFSQPMTLDWEKFEKIVFPPEIINKVFAYMPTNGSNTKEIYTNYWREISAKNNAEFLFVDNTLPESYNESEKINRANILLISGGNTFELLNNLRNSGLDKAVTNFSKKDNFVLAGFSAGAIVLSPTIEVASQPAGDDTDDLMDENLVGITDLSGLGIIDFEVFPHYNPEKDIKTLEKYRKQTANEVKEIRDDEYLVVEKT